MSQQSYPTGQQPPFAQTQVAPGQRAPSARSGMGPGQLPATVPLSPSRGVGAARALLVLVLIQLVLSLLSSIGARALPAIELPGTSTDGSTHVMFVILALLLMGIVLEGIALNIAQLVLSIVTIVKAWGLMRAGAVASLVTGLGVVPFSFTLDGDLPVTPLGTTAATIGDVLSIIGEIIPIVGLTTAAVLLVMGLRRAKAAQHG